MKDIPSVIKLDKEHMPNRMGIIKFPPIAIVKKVSELNIGLDCRPEIVPLSGLIDFIGAFCSIMRSSSTSFKSGVSFVVIPSLCRRQSYVYTKP